MDIFLNQWNKIKIKQMFDIIAVINGMQQDTTVIYIRTARALLIITLIKKKRSLISQTC